MKTNKNNSSMNLNRDSENDKLNRKRPEGPHSGMRPDRYPEGTAGENLENAGTDDSNIEELAADVEGPVAGRTTSSSPEDIAGVADLDNGMRRARKI
jgi:hypothetical protein